MLTTLFCYWISQLYSQVVFEDIQAYFLIHKYSESVPSCMDCAKYQSIKKYNVKMYCVDSVNFLKFVSKCSIEDFNLFLATYHYINPKILVYREVFHISDIPEFVLKKHGFDSLTNKIDTQVNLKDIFFDLESNQNDEKKMVGKTNDWFIYKGKIQCIKGSFFDRNCNFLRKHGVDIHALSLFEPLFFIEKKNLRLELLFKISY